MRISDWSSDVCSSDLRAFGSARLFYRGLLSLVSHRALPKALRPHTRMATNFCSSKFCLRRYTVSCSRGYLARRVRNRSVGFRLWRSGSARRSEEHTSELQSLMRITFAVFCLTTTKRAQAGLLLHSEYNYVVTC